MKKTTKTALISLLSTLVVMAMMFAMTGCNSSNDKTAETKATTAATQAQTEKQTDAPTQAQTEKATTAPTQAQEQENSDDPVMPKVTGTWKHENYPNACSVTVNIQNGNTLDFTVTSIKGNASQIATSDISVTLDTEYDGSLVRGYADFEYVDSFGCGGTGSISVSENAILLVINEEFNDGGRWSIANATGTYIFANE